ncbi:mpv17-like protein 2 [Diaphorina citri]|uniref:Mpv17-like protein 2 n=1 Tax=Diaphorina citri TaxID=121845 RepID=A0A1S4EHW9_DIACI|nr:mpv17-like protein 2 [Diaphorina citri]XP_017301757.1 mpv17-like protein 2 [Diaphorina citri]XP_017301758.1 mpv17-like protein 2 [Diaphorina citri]XP_026683278.1 mpv17-like protein 2 [Diaphorina citri]
MPTIFLKILRSKKLLSEWIRIGLAKESIKLKRENAMKNITTTRKLMFDRYLFVSNVSISVILSATGDILEQYYQNHINTERPKSPTQEPSWNAIRTFHMSLSGASVGILCHHGYRLLDKLYPGRALSTVFKKVLFDQIFISPVLISVFFVTLGIMENSSSMDIYNEIYDKGRRLYMAEWVVWPPAQVINFYFLSTKYRVLYDNTISLGYDVYTSYVKHDHS